MKIKSLLQAGVIAGGLYVVVFIFDWEAAHAPQTVATALTNFMALPPDKNPATASTDAPPFSATERTFNLSKPEPRWQFVTFCDSLPGKLFICAGSSPTNLTASPSYVFVDPKGGDIRDPTLTRYGGEFLLAYNTETTNGFGIATSPDGFHFNFAGNLSFSNNCKIQWAPEWFIDPTNQLHLLGLIGGQFGNVMIADISPSNLTVAANLRTITNKLNTDPYMLYANGIYHLFTSRGEYLSPAMDSGFVKLTNNPSGAEGSTVFYFAGKWWWLISNAFGYDVYRTSTDLTNWTKYVAFPWMPTNPCPGGSAFQQGTMYYVSENSAGIDPPSAEGTTSKSPP